MSEDKKVLTLDTAWHIMNGIVAEKGVDYVYPRAGEQCLYFEDGKPSCGVGLLISKINPDADAALEGALVFEAVVDATHYDEVEMTADVFLTAFQDLQDNGVPYGRALQAASVAARAHEVVTAHHAVGGE